MPLTSVIHLIRRLSEYGWEQRFLLEKTRMEKNKPFSCWIQKELVTVKLSLHVSMALLQVPLQSVQYCVSLFVHTDAPGANYTQDAGILVLTILISSILIYNTQNVPYKKDLEKLEYVYLFCFV